VARHALARLAVLRRDGGGRLGGVDLAPPARGKRLGLGLALRYLRFRRGALYRNRGDATFTDVTESAGVAARGVYGHGGAVGDGDGLPDLYLTAVGPNVLYRNNGDGRESSLLLAEVLIYLDRLEATSFPCP